MPHIALIPDGNRRWAKQRGLPGFAGHQAGAKTTEKILLAALERKIDYVSFWGCSVSNLTSREPLEVSFLLKLFAEYFTKLGNSKLVHEHQINITALGRWRDMFTAEAREAVEGMIEKTKNYSKFHLTFLLAYSGTEEMATAIQTLVHDQKPVTPEAIKSALYTKNLPPVDLVIRTGGEPHLSTGFMMWDTAESRLYFTDTYWPDFSPEELDKALDYLIKTEQRHGR